MFLPVLPYPQRLAVFPDIAASRSVLIPVQAAVVEILLFPVRARGGNTSRSSTKRLTATIPRGKLLRVKQERAAKPAVLSRPRSPRLADHPRRNWPQDPLHHGQVLPVVVRLRERNVKGRHGTDFSCSTSEPLAGQHLGRLYKTVVLEGSPSVPEAPGCAGEQPASSFSTWEVATQHTVLT